MNEGNNRFRECVVPILTGVSLAFVAILFAIVIAFMVVITSYEMEEKKKIRGLEADYSELNKVFIEVVGALNLEDKGTVGIDSHRNLVIPGVDFLLEEVGYDEIYIAQYYKVVWFRKEGVPAYIAYAESKEVMEEYIAFPKGSRIIKILNEEETWFIID